MKPWYVYLANFLLKYDPFIYWGCLTVFALVMIFGGGDCTKVAAP